MQTTIGYYNEHCNIKLIEIGEGVEVWKRRKGRFYRTLLHSNSAKLDLLDRLLRIRYQQVHFRKSIYFSGKVRSLNQLVYKNTRMFTSLQNKQIIEKCLNLLVDLRVY